MKFLFLSILFFLALSAVTQCKSEIHILFYNVENLFDTKDDPVVRDEEYTPTSKKKWNSKRYKQKLQSLAKVIAGADEDKMPVLIGLCEIENKNVVKDLSKSKALKKSKYEIVHYDSPDKRGIDVALMYRKSKINIIRSEALKVTFPNDDSTTTRDVLYVKIKLKKDTFHLFVNHWPSRRGGEKASQFKRMSAAHVVRNKIDQIQAINLRAQIIIMGDFNDYPSNKSIKTVLRASNFKNDKNHELFNLMSDLEKKGIGTHNYKGKWGMLDQFIITRNLRNNSKGWTLLDEGVSIVRHDWMLYHDKKYDNYKPNRTYVGSKYVGGYSDHLPILLKLCYQRVK